MSQHEDERIKHRMSIAPEELTINHGLIYLVSDRSLQIQDGGSHGLYYKDTRFLCHYRYRLNHQRPRLLAAGRVDYYSSLAHFSNPELESRGGTIAPNQLRLRVARQLDEAAVYEDLRVTNYGMEPLSLTLVVELKSDFADMFDVRGMGDPPYALVETVWDPEALALINSYRDEDFSAQLRYQIGGDARPSYANGELLFPIRLAPQESWSAAITMRMSVAAPAEHVERALLELRSGALSTDRLHARWYQLTTGVRAAEQDLQQAVETAREDLAALRLYLPELAEDVWMPAAGVPWFVTIFGRDSEITALQTLMLYPGFAHAALATLARYQGREVDEWRLEEPGKILHEIRFGRLALQRKIPHTPYYGTIDATPLFVVLLSEVWRWTADAELVRGYLAHARAAIEWCATYGDHDGDGFLDYWRWVERGLKNQGWKDSGNGIVYEDGSQVPNPIALVEFQGYVYDALLRMAELEEALGEQSLAEPLRQRAATLRARFHEAFWMEEEGFFALGLGPEGRVIRAIASNPGHALWSGIVRPELAERVARRLMDEDMFSGWGIRTLSALNPAFNPLDYQLGAIWPHDNALIALGLKRYGFAEEANRVARAILDAASFFEAYRLPELFGGFQRTSHSLPVLYPSANIPQAWAAGSIFQLLQAMLGLEADAPAGRLRLSPTLPEWLPSLAIENLRVGQARVDLAVRRAEDGSCMVTVERRQGVLEIVQMGADGREQVVSS